MKVTFRQSFLRDIKKIKDQVILDRIRKAIEQCEAAETVKDLRDLKRLSLGQDCYRIRVGEYRMGVTIQKNVIDFVRCLPRRDLYRYFP